MSSDLIFVNSSCSLMNKEAEEDISIDQDGEWDISLFDELDGLGDADELLEALVEGVCYDTYAPDLNFDIEHPTWNSDGWRENSSPRSDGDVTVDSLSPNHTLSSVSSPASVEPQSPYSTHDEVLSPLNWHSQPSPLSVCSDSSGCAEPPVKRRPPKRTNQATKAKLVQPAKRTIQMSPKVSIQPKPLINAVPIAHAAAPLQTKTIIIQPLQTAVLPVVKPPPVTIQPTPPAGRPMLLSQPTQVVQLHTPQAVATRVVTVPNLDRNTSVVAPVTATPVVTMAFQNNTPEDDSSVSRRQQRMIKNRESASLSRKKKKEYLLTLETRLKVALSENEKLKNENGTLKRQVEGLMSENSVLKATAPKRRAVCLMVVLVFMVFNLGPMSFLGGDRGSTFPAAPAFNGRHLLGFNPESERNLEKNNPETDPSNTMNRLEDVVSEQKALMVVKKDPLYFRTPPPCQPPVNRTKCMKITHELRGWVHRHEVERTKTRRMSNTQHRSRTILKAAEKTAAVQQIVTQIQYTDSSEKNPSNELQVYYAPRRTYNDFFDEINRRGDTFYVISFRRDHLLLPATNHNKGSRPKMSLVLPAINYNESVIKDKEFEVMMQIDCEVMDTRILHIKSSSVPPILRVNQTDTDSFYHSAPSNNQPATPVGVLVGSA